MELWWDGLCWHDVCIFNYLFWVNLLTNDISFQNWCRYGHQSYITGIDSLTRERCITSSDDKTIRVWKVIEETQLVFRYTTHTHTPSLLYSINWINKPMICEQNSEFNFFIINWLMLLILEGQCPVLNAFHWWMRNFSSVVVRMDHFNCGQQQKRSPLFQFL